MRLKPIRWKVSLKGTARLRKNPSTKRELERLARIEYIEANKHNLPHLYGCTPYKFQKRIWDSREKDIMFSAANQVGKSAIMISKTIHWATEPTLWKELWPKAEKPTQFWYCYPDSKTLNREYDEKWVKEFLPRGDMKNDPQYGWKEKKFKGDLIGIDFNTGVTVYFIQYTQDLTAMMASSVYLIVGDEEMPEGKYDELNVRRSGINVDGYFLTGFTSSIGEELWRRALEPEQSDVEAFPHALKMQVSLYDCLEYWDGTPSMWTVKEIKLREARCKSEAQVRKRIHGKLAIEEGLKYPAFARSRNACKDHKLPATWSIYAGVDIGSGGRKGHPGAVCFVAVSPDYKRGRVFLLWRGDGVETTAKDILNKYVELRGKMRVALATYDWSSADFGTIARQHGEAFAKAEKNNSLGEELLNVLFKYEMLKIYVGEKTEGHKLINELETLKEDTPKRKAKDDAIDSLRYAVTLIPWNFEDQETVHRNDRDELYDQMDERERMRYGMARGTNDNDLDILDDEFDLANECYEYGRVGPEDF
jgi:hypothetical protein